MRVEIPIDEVTLMEDRARVVRRGSVELQAGLNRLSIEEVSPLLVDKTLTARSATAQVGDVSIARLRLHRPEDRHEEIQQLEAALEEATDEVNAQRWKRNRVQEALKLLDQAADKTVEELAIDATWSRVHPDSWERRLDAIAELDARLRGERLETVTAIAEATRTRKLRQAALDSASTPSRALRAALTVTVETEVAGPHELTVEYVVPNACWRPYHRASWNEGTVQIETEGCIWQNTGEPWPEVQLRFSTQRPSLGAEPPTLATDRLQARRKAERIHVAQREQVVEDTGLGRTDPSAAELPGIDDGGAVQELKATHRASIASNGRPHRVELGAFESAAETTLVCLPEVSPCVVRKTAQRNEGAGPLLAGPVDLVRDGGFIGRTTLGFVARHERFELGWGPDAALRVHREVEETEEKSTMLSSWLRSTRTIRDRLSNLGPERKHIELVERVPVSEIEKVRIQVDEEKTGRSADEDGFVRWSLDLEPYGRHQTELRYVIERHSDVSGSF